MKNAKEFLDLCHRRFKSPRPSQRHTLTLEGDTMVLTLLMGDSFQQFNFAAEDLDKSAGQLLHEVIALFKKPDSNKKSEPRVLGPEDIA